MAGYLLAWAGFVALAVGFRMPLLGAELEACALIAMMNSHMLVGVVALAVIINAGFSLLAPRGLEEEADVQE